jgi:hypothetical protein
MVVAITIKLSIFVVRNSQTGQQEGKILLIKGMLSSLCCGVDRGIHFHALSYSPKSRTQFFKKRHIKNQWAQYK